MFFGVGFLFVLVLGNLGLRLGLSVFFKWICLNLMFSRLVSLLRRRSAKKLIGVRGAFVQGPIAKLENDPHSLCEECRGQSCSEKSKCHDCELWSTEQFKSYLR